MLSLKNRIVCKWLPVLLLLLAATAARAAEIDAGERTQRAVLRPAQVVLWPERHVVEGVRPPFSGNYIFNGASFTAKTAACARWISGERIRLVAGDWNGACTSAVFHNVARRMTCEMWCR